MKRFFKWLAFITVGCLIAGGISLQYYKKEIIASVVEMLEESIQGEISIENYDITAVHHFPDISISLRNVQLVGPDYRSSQPPFLTAKRIDINVDLFNLFKKRVSIKSVDVSDGEISIFRTLSGYTNFDVFKRKKDNDSAESEKRVTLDLKKLRLFNVMGTYVDSVRHQELRLRFIDTENSILGGDTTIQFHVAGKLKIAKLILNPENGAYLKDKDAQADLYMVLDPIRHHLKLTPSSIIFDKSTVDMAGIFRLAGQGSFELEIQSDKLDFKEGLSIITDRLAGKLARYQIESPLRLKVQIKQDKPASLPRVDVTFSFVDSRAKAGKVDMEKMTMEGVVTNHMDTTMANDDRNSQVKFISMRGVLNNLPMTGTATITNFMDPVLDLKATFDTEMTRLNEHLDTRKIKMTGGHFTSSFTYSGKLNEYLDETRTKYEGRLRGKAKIRNGHLQYVTKNVSIDKLDATFVFTEKKFEIRNLNLRVNKNEVLLKGSIRDFIPFFTTIETTGKVNLDITSPRFDVSGIIQPRTTEKTKASKSKSKKKIADMVELVNKKLEFEINFDIKEFVQKQFKATNATGSLTLADNKFILKKAAMVFAGGTVELNLNLRNLQTSISPFSLDAKLTEVNIKEFFRSFNNFHQTTFRDDHVDGKLSMDIQFDSEIDNNLDVLTPHIVSEATFSIQNGRLINFDPMQRLSNFLFKGRDFSNIQFGKINSEISMRGTAIDIRRMEVQSTALTMFIEGRYDLVDSSDLSIQVPLSNLKKREQDFAPENIGTDAKVGPSVFLRVHPDRNGTTTISYDPFKKFRKKKADKESRK